MTGALGRGFRLRKEDHWWVAIKRYPVWRLNMGKEAALGGDGGHGFAEHCERICFARSESGEVALLANRKPHKKNMLGSAGESQLFKDALRVSADWSGSYPKRGLARWQHGRRRD